MNWQGAVYIFPSLFAAALSVLLFLYLWPRRERVEVSSLLAITFALTVWTLGNALETWTRDLGDKTFWASMQYFGSMVVPVAWLVFALRSTGRGSWVTRPRLVLLCIVPIVTVAVVWTNPWHGLFWRDAWLDVSGPVALMAVRRGPAFAFSLGYNYLLVGTGVVLLLGRVFHDVHVYRRQAVVLLVGSLAPWLANVSYIAGVSPLPAKDLTPLVLSGSMVLLAWCLFRLRLLDVAPFVYEAVFQGMGGGIVVLDRAGNILIANDTASRILGQANQRLIGLPAVAFFPDLPRTEAAGGGDGSFCSETVIEHDGKQRFYELRMTPLRHLAGDPVGAVLILQDITERRRAEVALRESERRFRTLAENVPGVIYLCRNDPTWSMLYLSDAVEQLTGYPRDDFLEDRISFVDLYHPDDKAGIFERVEQSLELKEPFHLLYRIKHRDGDWRWIEELGIGIYRDGEVELLEGFLSDCTKRKQDEDALQFTQFAIEHCADAAFWMSADGHFTYVNRAACTLLEYSREELLSMGIGDIDPEYAEAIWEAMWNELKRQGMLRFDARHRTKSGRLVPVELTANFVEFQGKEYNCTFSRDVSERKRSEQERLELERQVLHSQKMESLGVLAGGIAHDFNNILAAVLGYTDLALQDLDAAHPARRSIEKASIGAQRAAGLTEQMLAYSGKGQFVVGPLNVSRTLEDVVHLLRTSIPKKVALNLCIDRDIPRIVADASQIQQVIMNMLTNASEAIGEEKGVVSVSAGVMECDAAYLAQSLTDEQPAPGRFVYVEVTDTGHGMDEDTQAKIFEPFFTTKFTGRGLGLAAVLGIVRGHGGAIVMHSEPGKGTDFRVLFPVSECEDGEPQSDAAGGPEDWHGSGTILVVDDEDIIRSLAKDALTRIGFEVLTASDGEEGLERLAEHFERVTCVLLDLTMPQMGGEDVLIQIRRMRKDLPVILSSGYSEEESSRRLSGEKPTAFIKKPYTIEELTAVLKAALAQSVEGSRGPA